MDMITSIDNAVFGFFESLNSGLADVFFKFFTYLGNAGIVWIAAGILMLFFRKTRSLGCCMLVCLALTFITNDLIIKPIVHRARPFIADPTIRLIISAPAGHSFPSGHTAAAFSCATVIFIQHKKAGLGAFLLAALIGASRIYLFVHYPTDVFCGAVIGIICGIVFSKLYLFIQDKIIEKINSAAGVQGKDK